MADENRVFDVSKPGSSKPETGSKPMVVGHKMMKDPTLKDTEDDKSEETQKNQQTVGKTIKPLDKKELNDTSDNNLDAKNEIDKSTTNEEKSEPHVKELEDNTKPEEVKIDDSDTKVKSDLTENEETPAQKEKSAQDYSIEQEENLQRIIKEKTYNVHIKEASLSAFKTFLKTFTIVVVIGLIVLIVLIDSEVLDLGLTLPFDFL